MLSVAAPSLHGSFKLRFNAKAQSALDATGEFPTGATFSDGSVIAKEIYSGNSLNLYAVMKKQPKGSSPVLKAIAELLRPSR